MARRVKMTGFARFVIVMMLLAPLAFIGASYYNGQDGIQNFKNLIGIESSEVVTDEPTREAPSENTRSNGDTYEIKRLKDELEYKNQRIEELLRENEMLKKQLEQ